MTTEKTTIVRSSLNLKKDHENKIANGAAFQTVEHFVKVFKLILNRPGISQSMIAKATGFNKAKVSKLCSQGVALAMFEKYKKGYLPGSIIKNYANFSYQNS